MRTIGAKDLVSPLVFSYHAIQKASGHDFSHTIDLLERMPPFLSGAAHKTTRKEMAVRYASINFKAKVDSFFTLQHEAMANISGTFDVLESFCKPLWITMVSDFGLSSDALMLAERVPDLFNSTSSLRQRIQIEGAIRSLDATSEELDLIALVALGVRPLVGSLAGSIHHLAKACGGQVPTLSGLPTDFPFSSLQFVDRFTELPTHESFSPTDRYRCRIFDASLSPEENAKTLFGAGTHICLGKSISQYVWNQTCEFWTELGKPLGPLEIQIEDREPFYLPTVCLIEIHA